VTPPADLVVWRHGRTEWNDTGRFQGHLDTALDAVGHAQSRAAALVLSATFRPAAVVSSDLARARDTAAYLGLPVTPDARLREIDVGEWGGLTRPEIEARFPETYAAWLRGDPDVRREGGETLPEVAARAVAAVREQFDSVAGPLVAVTHGGTSRALVLSLLGVPLAHGSAFVALGNARWATLVRHGDGWRLTAYNAGVGAPTDAATTEPVL
jgi:broad specificity phosphatase PhoE